MNADLFTVAHFRANTKTTNILVRELFFADESALIVHSAEEIQRIVDAFTNASSKCGLNINIRKTEVMFQPNSTTTMEEDINVDETTLNHVKEFTYLDSIIAIDGHIEAELQKRMSRGSMSFGRLRERLWNNHNVSIRVQGKIYRANTLSILLYGAEPWTVYRRHVKKMHTFMVRHLRSIMNIRWQDKMTNIKVLKRAGLTSMEHLLIRKNIRWTGHLLMIPIDRPSETGSQFAATRRETTTRLPTSLLQRHNQKKSKENGS